VDQRTDVWTVSIPLAELVRGKRPLAPLSL
jgi:hypothetical protein